jgi:hypothetical protein
MAAPCSQEYVSCGVILEVGVLGTRYLRGPASLKQRFVFTQVGSSRMWRHCRGIGSWRGRRQNVSEILLIHPGDTDTLWCWSWRFWFPAAGMLPLMGSREQGMRVRVDRGGTVQGEESVFVVAGVFPPRSDRLHIRGCRIISRDAKMIPQCASVISLTPR